VDKSVVIGGNGFIGSHLVDALVQQGHEVRAFDRFSSGSPQFTSSEVNIQSGDFLSISDLKKAIEGQDYVFHFLSTTTPATAEDDPTLDIRTNVAQTVELLKLASDANVKHVYFGSTGGAIYGSQGREIYSENDRALPISPYGIGKLTIEHYLDYFRAKKHLSSTSLRISNPYGTRQKPQARQGLIPISLRNIAQGKPVLRYGDGSMVRDFVFVNDAVQMIIQLVGRENQHTLYNIGSGVGVSVNHVIETIRRMTGKDFEIQEIPVPPTFVDSVILDTSRFCDEFGTVEFTPLEQGILLTLEESYS
jgi:UDP-glucose 4-epimerase